MGCSGAVDACHSCNTTDLFLTPSGGVPVDSAKVISPMAGSVKLSSDADTQRLTTASRLAQSGDRRVLVAGLSAQVEEKTLG